MRSYRTMLREQQARAKHLEREEAADEVAQYERYVDLLVSLHRECSEPWSWHAHAASSPPPRPERTNERERDAAATRDAYAPGFFERLFGGAKARRSELQRQVSLAAAADEWSHGEAIKVYEREYISWQLRREIGRRIVAGDYRAYGDALNFAAAFDELASFQTRVEIVGARGDALAFDCRITDDELVPVEEMSLTSRGKLSTKDMPKSRYHALYQDHVCSAAIRVAREALAIVPIRLSVVNVSVVRVSPRTGHREPVTLLAAQFTHENLGRINVQQVDPSEAISNLPHRMRFKKTSGLEGVAPMSLDENWMTSE